MVAYPINPTYTTGCNTPTFPEATFNFPQTLCLNETTAPTDLKNQLANGYEWLLTRPDGTEQLFDNENPTDLSFDQPGTHYLRQTIYVLGCAYESERSFEVIDRAEVASETITVCEFPADIALPTNCDSLDVHWDDGSIGTRSVTAPGTYAVTVCTGLCANEFMIEVRRAGDDLTDLFPFPSDSTVCTDELPLLLPTLSDLPSFVNGLPAPFALTEAGTYSLSYLVDGCTLEQSFALETIDCTPQLFLPNGFSPNHDGVNDHFEPLGNEFYELRALEVYDRWGARIFAQTGGRLRWDGQTPNGPAGAGTYVVRVRYVDVRTGVELETAGDVVLLR